MIVICVFMRWVCVDAWFSVNDCGLLSQWCVVVDLEYQFSVGKRGYKMVYNLMY